MKRLLLIAAALLMLCGCAAGEDTLRGYEKGKGYQYVLLGEYPYEKDGTAAPVLWRILDVEDGKALLLTEYVIDTQQAIFETDQKVIEKRTYRRINHYEESDICPWLDTEMVDRLFGQDPIVNALIKENGSRVFILTSEQFLTTKYGFSANMWNEQKSRQAQGTPYAIKQRNLYQDSSGCVSYWAATIKDPKDYKLQLVGYNGHLSWGAYTRVNVGLRLSVRMDLSMLTVDGGEGTKKDPFRFVYAGEVPAAAEVTVAEVLPQATAMPENVNTDPAETIAPVETEAVAPAPETEEASAYALEKGEILISFVGDCSIGDSEQYTGASSSYHTTVDEKGYEWPFSLVKDYLLQDDLTVANLEVVFTNRKKHTEKQYNLVADPDHVQILIDGGIDMVNTVNNHCMDFMQTGYQDSIDTLDEAGIARFGTVYPGQKHGYDDLGVQQVGDIKIGFIGFTYPQDSDQKKIASRIKKLKEEQNCDLVVVSLHWGRETHMTPEAWQVAYAKKVIDAGADLIWGHHPHVIQPIHFYKGKPILYSTGNFTFGTMSKVDPSTGIFQFTYEKTDGTVQLKKLQVIPCETQGSPDYRPFELTEEEERQAVFKELVLKKTYSKCVNPPDSFLETGIINFENGEMLP
ncbi:MAG: CapA family protein [Clostridiales bacterium]|nr:CapA family protein [Clostridiales bacterium]